MIGVLGGMGPVATADFFSKVIAATSAGDARAALNSLQLVVETANVRQGLGQDLRLERGIDDVDGHEEAGGRGGNRTRGLYSLRRHRSPSAFPRK